MSIKSIIEHAKRICGKNETTTVNSMTIGKVCQNTLKDGELCRESFIYYDEEVRGFRCQKCDIQIINPQSPIIDTVSTGWGESKTTNNNNDTNSYKLVNAKHEE